MSASDFELIELMRRGHASCTDAVPCSLCCVDERLQLAVYDQLRDVLACMVHEDDPCWFDHHGYCQAHGWLQEGECPHGRAKALLNAWSAASQEPTQ